MKLFKKLFTMIVAIFCFLGLWNSCGNPEPKLTLSQTTAEVYEGDKFTLIATAEEGSTIVWDTSDSEILSVKGKGVNATVTALKEGSADVIASVDDYQVKCSVTVKNVTLSLDKTTASVNRGETLQLNASCNVENAKLYWSSSNDEVASVSNSGLVTGNDSGEATISVKYSNEIIAQCVVTVVWENKPVDYQEITFLEEANITEDKKFFYWNDQNWVGSYVDVSRAIYQNGALEVSWSGSTAKWFGFQIFYKDSSVEAGKNYKLETTITATYAGQLTINGHVVDLVEGKNDVAIYMLAGGTAFSLQAGVEASGYLMQENDLIITHPVYTEYTPVKLQAPTALSISSDKIVTITDANEGNNNGYRVAFCDSTGAIVYTQNMKSGDAIEDAKFASGTYDIKVMALSKNQYSDSDYSAILSEYVIGEKTVEYDLEYYGEGPGITALGAGVYFYWTEFSGIENAKFKDGEITLNVVNDGNWYSNQLFYKDSSLVEGQSYTLTMKIDSDVAESITVNGNVIALEIGTNDVSVNFTQGGLASISIQFGVNGGTALKTGSFKIYNVHFAQ